MMPITKVTDQAGKATAAQPEAPPASRDHTHQQN